LIERHLQVPRPAGTEPERPLWVPLWVPIMGPFPTVPPLDLAPNETDPIRGGPYSGRACEGQSLLAVQIDERRGECLDDRGGENNDKYRDRRRRPEFAPPLCQEEGVDRESEYADKGGGGREDEAGGGLLGDVDEAEEERRGHRQIKYEESRDTAREIEEFPFMPVRRIDLMAYEHHAIYEIRPEEDIPHSVNYGSSIMGPFLVEPARYSYIENRSGS